MSGMHDLTEQQIAAARELLTSNGYMLLSGNTYAGVGLATTFDVLKAILGVLDTIDERLRRLEVASGVVDSKDSEKEQ